MDFNRNVINNLGCEANDEAKVNWMDIMKKDGYHFKLFSL